MNHVHYFSKIYLEDNTDILLGESTAHIVQNNMFIFLQYYNLIQFSIDNFINHVITVQWD